MPPSPPEGNINAADPSRRSEAPKQHGVKGAYVGGKWIDIEECDDKFNIKDGSCGNNCEACPRSKSRNNAALSDGSYDVVIIGAGCIGGAIARELSKYKLSVLLLEAADDVTQGATKGNSGIVHAGFDDKPGTNRAKFCWPGNQMFEDLDNDLHFGYQKNGSLVIASSKEEEAHLKELKKRGETNGVKRLRIIGKDELFKLEPYVNPAATAALLSPDAGNLIPYEYTIALIENAVDNGVELRIRRQVENIIQDVDGGFTLQVNHWEPSVYLDNIGGNPNYLLFTLLSSIVAIGVCYITNIHSTNVPNKAIIDSILTILPLLSTTDNVLIAIYSISSLVLAVLLQILIVGEMGKSSDFGSLESSVKRATRPEGTGGRKVDIDEMKVGGTGSASVMNGRVVEVESIKCKYIVNAAGSASDKIAKMVGDNSFKIKPRIGDYILLNRNQGHLSSHTLFPCPGPLGKGVLVQTTLWGNLILGPTARDVHDPAMKNLSDKEVQEFILGKCSNLVPYFDSAEVIHGFAGARAKSDRGDWIIEACPTNPHFIHAAGIDSPGLAGSPAIAKEIVRLLNEAGLQYEFDPSFNPKRAPIIIPKDGYKGLKMAVDVSKSSTKPTENVVCRCEKVTEQEIVTALRRNLPLDSTQAIRKRTRAGMGHCQGKDVDQAYNCECRVAAIVARENKIPVEAVGRRPWPATSNLPQRWVTQKEREELAAMQTRI